MYSKLSSSISYGNSGQQTSIPSVPQIRLLQNSHHAPCLGCPGLLSTLLRASPAGESHQNVTSETRAPEKWSCSSRLLSQPWPHSSYLFLEALTIKDTKHISRNNYAANTSGLNILFKKVTNASAIHFPNDTPPILQIITPESTLSFSACPLLFYHICRNSLTK